MMIIIDLWAQKPCRWRNAMLNGFYGKNKAKVYHRLSQVEKWIWSTNHTSHLDRERAETDV